MSNVERFYNSYRKVKDLNSKSKDKKTKEFINEYRKLLIEKRKTDIWLSPKYSIFDVLKFSRPEEQIHSPFIFHLLDTKGEHKQGDRFYKLFINSIIPKSRSSQFINVDSSQYFFKLEQKTISKIGDGRIDIFIKSKNTKKPFAVIFELKWNSPDSSQDQIYKYYSSIKESKEYSDDKVLMIYLTKKGRPPKLVKSRKFVEIINNKNHQNFISISYEKEILNWLELCISECKSNKVKETINQYIEHLKSNL